jgi:uncharacterized membrane protein (DUF485 family)
MEQKPFTNNEEDKSIKYKAKVGVWMFLGYFIVYAVFIIINVFKPKVMGLDIGSLNLAIVYGFGLIVLALIMALIYNALCGWSEEKGKEKNKLIMKEKSQ